MTKIKCCQLTKRKISTTIFFLLSTSLLYFGFAYSEYEYEDRCNALIRENWDNSHYIVINTVYPEDWVCCHIANAYMENNTEWRVFEIYAENDPIGHAANYIMIGDRMFVHDEYWQREYELLNWQNLPIRLYDYNETVPVGLHLTFFKLMLDYQ